MSLGYEANIYLVSCRFFTKLLHYRKGSGTLHSVTYLFLQHSGEKKCNWRASEASKMLFSQSMESRDICNSYTMVVRDYR